MLSPISLVTRGLVSSGGNVIRAELGVDVRAREECRVELRGEESAEISVAADSQIGVSAEAAPEVRVELVGLEDASVDVTEG